MTQVVSVDRLTSLGRMSMKEEDEQRTDSETIKSLDNRCRQSRTMSVEKVDEKVHPRNAGG